MTVRPSRRAGARIAIAGAAERSAPVRELRRAELADVRFIDAAQPDDAALDGIDMLVLVAAAGDVPDVVRMRALADAARERGILVAALLTAGADGGPSPLLAALRDAADLVMVVRAEDDVRAIVAALR